MPLLVDLQPAGRFLMEDLHRAGGLLAVLREVRDLLDPTRSPSPAGRWSTTSTTRPIWDAEVIRPALGAAGGRGRHRGAARQPRPGRRAHQARRRLAAPAAAPRPGRRLRLASRTSTPASTTPTSTSTPTRCSCCAAADPRAIPGMPEVANMPLPKKLLEQGVRDMVRVCDGRMSGTAYGTVVLHVAPEAAAGGPLALVRTGDVDQPSTSPPAASTSRSPPTSWRGGRRARRRSPAFAEPAARLGAALRRPRAAGRHRRRPRLPRRLQRIGGQPGVALRLRRSRTRAGRRGRPSRPRRRTRSRSWSASAPGGRTACGRGRTRGTATPTRPGWPAG